MDGWLRVSRVSCAFCPSACLDVCVPARWSSVSIEWIWMSVCVSVYVCVCKSLTSTSLVYYLTSLGFRPLSLLVSGVVAVAVVVGAGSAACLPCTGGWETHPLVAAWETHRQTDIHIDRQTDRQQ